MEVWSQGQAAVLEEPVGISGVQLRDRPRTRPEAGMVSVALRCAAINHLDLWVAEGFDGFPEDANLPRVLSADGAGVVEESADPRWSAGDEVVLYPIRVCWECHRCRAGEQVFCEEFGVLGEIVDGAACELIHIDARNLYPKPKALSWEEAAALPLTYLTAWRMLTTRARLRAGETLLVVGASAGVGAAAIQIGRHIGARVLATSRSAAKREMAQGLGAEAVFNSRSFKSAVLEATGGSGADVVVEHVGPATFEESLEALRPGGRLVTCGSTTGDRIDIPTWRFIAPERAILGSTMGNAVEFEELLAAVGDRIRPVVDSTYPLTEIRAAMEHLARADQFGKVVLEVG